ncbi:MAG TPA: SIS domain-containing protein [Candidatus Paceibacterota bacterium]|jgi:glucose/mannose-6-phosphate isomerase|nr:SIS domain-containing protein [Candidatus Paceibacterota bacterium]
MILDDIKNYPKQFAYEPKVENEAKLKKAKKFIVAGMGGSHLAADIIKTWHPELDLITWSNYGLPALKEADLKERLIILSSYSGTTEETIDAFNAARAKHLAVAVIASRGKLVNLADKFKIPYVQMPDFHLQPRMALGLSLKSMLALMGEKTWLAEATELATLLHPGREEHRSRDLAKRLHGSVPVIYASARNTAIAQNWKIKFNETGKIPAFWNVVPELNHNEMTGFDSKGRTPPLSRHFHFVFLKDGGDDRRIIKRMSVLEKLLKDRGFKIEVILLQGKNELHKIFNALSLADWTAYFTAGLYAVEPEQVPMVEEFKGLIARGG